MTRKQYLKELENNLYNLPQKEIDEAIKYYSDYFEDAQNDEEVMKYLGTPYDLAQTIISQVNTGLSVTKNTKDSFTYKIKMDSAGASFGPFNANSIQNLDIDLKAGEITIVEDTEFFIDGDELTDESVEIIQTGDTLKIIAPRRNLNKNFVIFGIPIGPKMGTDLTLHIPSTLNFNKINATVGCGDLSTDQSTLNARELNLKVGTGNITIEQFKGGTITSDCGMGNIEVRGTITGHSSIKCGLGNVELNLKGNPEDYSVNGKIGLGNFEFNSWKKMGNCSFETEKKENNFDVEVGLGNVEIHFIK